MYTSDRKKLTLSVSEHFPFYSTQSATAHSLNGNSFIPPILTVRFARADSAMAFGCNVLGLFRQLGIEQEFLEHAKPTMNLEVFNHDMKSLLKFDFSKQEEA